MGNNKGFSMIKVVLIILVLLVVGIISAIAYFNNSLQPINIDGEEKVVDIPNGYTLKGISNLLEEEGIIKDKMIFEFFVKKEKKANSLQAGKYLLSPAMSSEKILDIISNGQVIDESIIITFPEGWTLMQMAERLEDNGLCSKDDFLTEAKEIEKYKSEYSFLQDIKNEDERTLDGYLFPNTYYFSKDSNVEDIIRKMLDGFNKIIKEEYYNQAESMGYSFDDIVILASIVEQETKYDEDRPLVASVFYNRLDKGMYLQSDVTVLYALGIKKEKVLYEDLEVDSKYNTYKYSGLPFGPIGSISEATLKAALYPEESDYYYFIAKKDGYCIFNVTFAEHNADVRKYLK